MTEQRETVIIVHGGAWDIPAAEHEAHLAGMRAALEAGRRILEAGGSALDAVEEAVSLMEEDPTFDAGRGSCLNTDGSVEMDASIMNGRDLGAGAVAALRNFLHPVKIARRVMEETEHILLAGEGAADFARRQGFAPVDPMELLTEREKQRLAALRRDHGFRTPYAFGAERPDDRAGPGTAAPAAAATSPLPASPPAPAPAAEPSPPGDAKRGTVGAVVRDGRGDIAAATSTGGTPKKIPGRVGDSALIGCATFADNRFGAVSVTGWGESIMRAGTARTVMEGLKAGASAEEAAAFAIEDLSRLVKGLGGVIVISAAGCHAAFYNTPCMARGWWRSGMAAPFAAI